GCVHILADVAGRGSRSGLEPRVDCAVGLFAGYGWKRQCEVELPAAAQGRRRRARDDDCRSCACVGCTGDGSTTSKGEVLHGRSGRRINYGELVPAARALPLPDLKTVKLKDPAQFTLIGKATQH